MPCCSKTAAAAASHRHRCCCCKAAPCSCLGCAPHRLPAQRLQSARCSAAAATGVQGAAAVHWGAGGSQSKAADHWIRWLCCAWLFGSPLACTSTHVCTAWQLRLQRWGLLQPAPPSARSPPLRPGHASAPAGAAPRHRRADSAGHDPPAPPGVSCRQQHPAGRPGWWLGARWARCCTLPPLRCLLTLLLPLMPALATCCFPCLQSSLGAAQRRGCSPLSFLLFLSPPPCLHTAAGQPAAGAPCGRVCGAPVWRAGLRARGQELRALWAAVQVRRRGQAQGRAGAVLQAVWAAAQVWAREFPGCTGAGVGV